MTSSPTPDERDGARSLHTTPNAHRLTTQRPNDPTRLPRPVLLHAAIFAVHFDHWLDDSYVRTARNRSARSAVVVLVVVIAFDHCRRDIVQDAAEHLYV